MPSAFELSEQLTARGRRPAGSDAERRTALWLADQINAAAGASGRSAELETFWSRPSWITAQLWHILLAVGGSMLATTRPKAGAIVIFAALAFMLMDWVYALSPGRWLSFERASQNVVAATSSDAPVTLIITADYGTAGLDLTHYRRVPGWLFWLALATLWVLVTALLRIDQAHPGRLIPILQFIPTIGLVLAFAGLLVYPRPADNAAGVAAALSLTRALDAAPPANLAVELVLTGASAGYGLGLRRYLRGRRKQLDRSNVVVLGIEGNDGCWYLRSDGPLLPVAFFGELRRLAGSTGMMTERFQRGCSAALPARLRALPALTIGGDPDAVLTAGLILVDEIDAYVAGVTQPTPPRRVAPRPRRALPLPFRR